MQLLLHSILITFTNVQIKKVFHLHGEVTKSRNTIDSRLVYNIKGWELRIGEKCEKGSQLRPQIVWYGEPIPEMAKPKN